MPRKKTDETTEDQDYDELSIPRFIGDPGDDDDGYADLDLADDTDDEDLDDDDYDDEDDDDPRYAALQGEMENIKSLMQQQGNFYQTAMAQLMANGNGRDQAAAGEETGAFNLEDLPDPVENRAEFNKALADRVKSFVTGEVTKADSRASTSNLEQQLTNNFYRDYPELAKKSALFRAAVSEEAAILRNSGGNPAAAIGADPDGFLTRVANRMHEELGTPEDQRGGDGGDEGGRHTRRRRQAKGGADRSRTRNLGRRSRPKRRGGKPNQQKKPKGFIAELRQKQTDMGLI